jgi:hypothetical protein
VWIHIRSANLSVVVVVYAPFPVARITSSPAAPELTAVVTEHGADEEQVVPDPAGDAYRRCPLSASVWKGTVPDQLDQPRSAESSPE